MNPITLECPHCHETSSGDESWYGQRVKCPKCEATMLVPPAPVGAEPPTARLIREPAAAAPLASVPDEAIEEVDIFKLSPVARAYAGVILLGVIFLGLAAGSAIRSQDLPWPPWVPLVPLAFGVLLLLGVWVRVKSSSYRLTTQRLFIRRGWLAKNVNELELYRVSDVVVNQGSLQRLLGYGTITVLADDTSTPQVDLVGVSGPIKIKELIRTHYRAARRREGVHPAELMHSP